MEKVNPNISCIKPVYIQDFIIDENYQSKGYGTILLNVAKQWAKVRNLDYI